MRAFNGYIVDSSLMSKAARGAIFLHCLPAHRGEEVSEDVIEGPQSKVWDQAENRLHIQKAIMATLMGGEAGPQGRRAEEKVDRPEVIARAPKRSKQSGRRTTGSPRGRGGRS